MDTEDVALKSCMEMIRYAARGCAREMAEHASGAKPMTPEDASMMGETLDALSNAIDIAFGRLYPPQAPALEPCAEAV